MPRCGCQDACSCLITAGEGISVEGIGTIENPYEITSQSSDLTGRIEFTDDGNVDFTVTGVGTLNDPTTVFADAVLAVTDLTDVSDADPTDGDVLVWRLDHWEFEAQTGTGGGTGLPAGGADGQVLTKQSSTDGDANWETLPAAPSGGGVVEPTYSTSRRQATGVPCANGAVVQIPWDTSDYADGISCDAAGVFTFPVAGYYQVNAKVAFAFNATGKREIRVLLNGASAVPGIVLIPPIAATSGTAVQFSRLLKVAAGDTLLVQATQNSGVTLDAGSAGVAYNSIDITKVPTLSPGGGGVVVERPTAARRRHLAATSILNATITAIPFDTEDYSDGIVWDAAQSAFNVPSDGYYDVEFGLTYTANATGVRVVYIQVNGITQSVIQDEGTAGAVAGSSTVRALAGGTIQIKSQQTSGASLSLAGTSPYNYVSVTKVPVSYAGSAVSTYGERNYSTSRRQGAAVSCTTGTVVTIPWDTEDYTDGIAFAAGAFTVPVAGYYQVSAKVGWDANGAGFRRLRILVNSSSGVPGYGMVPPSASGNTISALTRTLKLAAGDQITVGVDQTSGVTLGTVSSTGFNSIDITKVPAPVVNGAAASGVWGVAPLDSFYGTDSTRGAPVYIDSAGQLRAQPSYSAVSFARLVTDLIGTYPIGTSVMTIPSGGSSVDWPAGGSCTVVTQRRVDTVGGQWCYLNSGTVSKAWYRNGGLSWAPWVLLGDSSMPVNCAAEVKFCTDTVSTPNPGSVISHARYTKIGRTVTYWGAGNMGTSAVVNGALFLPPSAGVPAFSHYLPPPGLSVAGGEVLGKAFTIGTLDRVVYTNMTSSAYYDFPANSFLTWNFTYEVL